MTEAEGTHKLILVRRLRLTQATCYGKSLPRFVKVAQSHFSANIRIKIAGFREGHCHPYHPGAAQIGAYAQLHPCARVISRAYFG